MPQNKPKNGWSKKQVADYTKIAASSIQKKKYESKNKGKAFPHSVELKRRKARYKQDYGASSVSEISKKKKVASTGASISTSSPSIPKYKKKSTTSTPSTRSGSTGTASTSRRDTISRSKRNRARRQASRAASPSITGVKKSVKKTTTGGGVSSIKPTGIKKVGGAKPSSGATLKKKFSPLSSREQRKALRQRKKYDRATARASRQAAKGKTARAASSTARANKARTKGTAIVNRAYKKK